MVGMLSLVWLMKEVLCRTELQCLGNTAAILEKHSARNHNGAFRLIVWDAPIKYTNVY